MIKRIAGAIRRWLLLEPIEVVDDSALDPLYARRFGSTDRERFNRLWREVARIVRVSPLQMHEDDQLQTLAQAASWFPYTVMEQVADFASDEAAGVPDRQLTTVGELLDWVLAHPRVEKSR